MGEKRVGSDTASALLLVKHSLRALKAVQAQCRDGVMGGV